MKLYVLMNNLQIGSDSYHENLIDKKKKQLVLPKSIQLTK